MKTRTRTALAASTLVLPLMLASCAQQRDIPEALAYYGDEERPAPSIAMGDPATVQRIIDLGMTDNRVMDHLTHLCAEIGPRLTGSTRAELANEWTRDQFASWGLTNAKMDKWGEVSLRFDRHESYAKVLYKPTGRRPGPDADSEGWEVLRECDFTWLAWSVGTEGPTRGKVVLMPRTEAELNEVIDELPGAWVMLDPGYSGRSGIRSIGAAMRQRTTQRHEVRSGKVTADAGADDIVGTFEGEVSGGGMEGGIPLTMRISRNSDGSLKVIGDVPGFPTHELTEVTLEGSNFGWVWTVDDEAVRFNGTLAGGRIAGKATDEDGTAFDVVATKAAAAPAAPVSNDPLVGRWVGKFAGTRAPDGIDFITTITKNDDGSYGGTGEIPGYRSSELANIAYDLDSNAMTFTWQGTASDYQFRVMLDGNKFSGVGISGDSEYTLTGVRAAADAPAPAPAAAPAHPDSILARVLDAGPAGFLSSSRDARVWTTSANDWREMTTADLPQDPEIGLSEPDFDFIGARMAEGMDLRFEADLACTFTDGPIPVYNTVAEIRGTEKPDEYVIVSAHLDSWNGPGSMGTVDNGTGSSVTLEAARLLMAAGAKPKRTIKFILWTGEEQGLLGSKAWVEQNQDLLPKISAVFVDDGGTNYEGGLLCIEEMADYLAAASAPINNRFYSEVDGKYMNVRIRVADSMPRGGGSDHASFNRAGVPGFFWDEVGRANYRHGWHTQFDQLDQAIPEYLRQSATCAAVTAYNLACAPEMLPRQVVEEEEEVAAGAR